MHNIIEPFLSTEDQRVLAFTKKTKVKMSSIYELFIRHLLMRLRSLYSKQITDAHHTRIFDVSSETLMGHVPLNTANIFSQSKNFSKILFTKIIYLSFPLIVKLFKILKTYQKFSGDWTKDLVLSSQMPQQLAVLAVPLTFINFMHWHASLVL